MRKLESLQVVRALAFLGILTSHCGISELGAWGVSVFLMLSGFVMVYNYLPKSDTITVSWKANWNFSIKKIAKLYPLHLLMMCIMVLLELVIWGEEIVARLKPLTIGIMTNVLLVQTWIPQGTVYFSLNGVAWYLSCCVFLYFMFPYLLKRISKYSCWQDVGKNIIYIIGIQLLIAILSNCIAVPTTISNNFPKWITYILPIYRLGDFAIGCNLGYIFLQRKEVAEKRGRATLAELVTLVLIVVSRQIYLGLADVVWGESVRYTLLFTPSSMALVYLFAKNQGAISQLLTNKVLIYLGNISAYAFLIHVVVIQCLSVTEKHAKNVLAGGGKGVDCTVDNRLSVRVLR